MNLDDRTLVRHVLDDAFWLTGFPAAMRDQLAAEGRLIRLNTGEWAQAEGDDRGGLFLVVQGALHTYCAATGDRVVMIGVVGPGAVLGHATPYSGGPRLVTAVCVEPSVLLEISVAALERIAAHFPEIWRAIAGFAYAHTRSALRMAADVISLPPRQRIAARLLTMGESNILHVNQELLGEMIGLTRKTVNQHLSALERAELVQIGYSKITICNAAGLQAIAEGDA